MATETLKQPETKRPDGYPFHIGTRLVNHRDAEGNIVGHHHEPLTEEGYLHPQEEDRFMSTDRHSVALHYLKHALAVGLGGQTRFRVFTEMRVDWQQPGIEPHGPDAIVFDGFQGDFDDMAGTVPVEDFAAKVLVVFEVTSPSTRHIDFGLKLDEFVEVGIPYFMVIDAAAPNGVPTVIGMRLVRGGYRTMRNDPKLGVQVPELKLWFRWDRDRLVAADIDGKDIPDSAELGVAFEGERARAESEKARAESEKARAETEKARADAADAKAEALAAELAELKARLNEAS